MESTEIMKRVGQRLAAHRRFHGVNQEELARRCGLSQTSVAQIERGHVPRAAFVTIWRLAQELGLSLDQLAEEAPAAGTREAGELRKSKTQEGAQSRLAALAWLRACQDTPPRC